MTSVEQGRAAFARQAWREALAAFAAAGPDLDAVDQPMVTATGTKSRA